MQRRKKNSDVYERNVPSADGILSLFCIRQENIGVGIILANFQYPSLMLMQSIGNAQSVIGGDENNEPGSLLILGTGLDLIVLGVITAVVLWIGTYLFSKIEA